MWQYGDVRSDDEDIALLVRKVKLVFHTLNSSRSAYQSITLKPSFFDVYMISGAQVQCSMQLKAVCSVLRTPTAGVDYLIVPLPDKECIIDHIFSFLEARDTIRASAVSRNWRYLWVSMLCFNFDFMEPYWENQINLPPTTSGDIYARYKDFVNWLLISRNRSIDNERASLFWLHVPGDYSVHRWIKVLSRSKVQKFDLTMCTHVPSVELPHCLVTCHSLVALKLDVDRNCVMNLPTRAGFTNFNTLGISATRLEKLAIFSWEPHIDDGLENLTVKVACPSLVTLEFRALSVADFKF
ncbi:hypothetical protein JRO89_XS01G0009800 [Xanthoceras sorbifolium]|uniref:F-box domain-containing protein n=1 Tax=Xanthoceras sorbifolium TaxID=99658 RepID=A0ABQ8IJ45_9ROSI|nr:hypothetical protein JRO89_XS01G0009800 [Xanthoceras sorbifolium]